MVFLGFTRFSLNNCTIFQDFLNDIGQKEEEYYSQKIESEKNSPKRRKIEEIDFLSDTSFDDEPDFAKFTSKSIEPTAERSEKRETFQNKISSEDNLQKRQSGRNEISSKINDVTRNLEKKSQSAAKCESIENVEISRRKLALEILRKGAAARENVSMEKNSLTRSSPLAPLQSLNEKNSRPDNEQTRRKNLQESFKKPLPRVSKISSGLGASNSNAKQMEKTDEQTRRKSLLESLKKPHARVSKLPGKFGETNSAKDLIKDRSLAIPRVTRVRKFPGPAGLLPDCPEANFESGNFLNRSDAGNVVEPSEENEDSGMSEYLSQTTEKLFSAGAWQSMLEDLPEGFLRGHEIATMKKTAKSNSRVSLLAGVIARIDHSRQNPRLILKDLSDSIEATMHPDILLAHPNIFEPGVVVLLRHVGVLGFQTSPIFPTLQFHVMIAAKNIGAVYSEKSRIVTSPWIESILGANSSKSRKLAPRRTEDEIIDETMKNASLIEDDIDMSGFESDDDDTFASFNVDDLADSQIATNSSTFSPQIPAHMSPADKIVRNNEIKSNIAQPEPNHPSNLGLTDEFVTERCSSAITITENPKESSLPAEPKNTAKITQLQSQQDSATRFSEPPIELSDPPNLPQEIHSNPTGFGDNLMDSDNDTEDEILSQLDVDSIVTTYNSQT